MKNKTLLNSQIVPIIIDIPACSAVTATGECFNYLFDNSEGSTKVKDLFKKVTFKLNKKIDNLKINLPKLNIISNINNEIVIFYDKEKIKIEEIIKLIKKDGLEIIDGGPPVPVGVIGVGIIVSPSKCGLITSGVGGITRGASVMLLAV